MYKYNQWLVVFIFIATSCIFSTVQSATAWDFAEDWSDQQNPNGPWSLERNNALISTYVSNWNGSAFPTAQGAWIVNDNTAQVPNFFKRSGIGGSYDIPIDMTAGHSPGANQGVSSVVWTSPISGTIDVSGIIWDASPLYRAVQWDLLLNGTSITGGS